MNQRVFGIRGFRRDADRNGYRRRNNGWSIVIELLQRLDQ